VVGLLVLGFEQPMVHAFVVCSEVFNSPQQCFCSLDYLGRAMGHVACKLQQNTRSPACVVVPAKYDAPSLQLAINTIPSLHPGKFGSLKARGLRLGSNPKPRSRFSAIFHGKNLSCRK
jgi:hypothetical protein